MSEAARTALGLIQFLRLCKRNRKVRQYDELGNVIRRLNEYDIELVEQPVRRYDFEGLCYVTANSPVPIMAVV